MSPETAPSSFGEVMKSPENDETDLIKHEIDIQETEANVPRFRYASGVPGLGNCILGPHIPGSSKTAPTTIVTPLDTPAISSLADVYASDIPSGTPAGIPNPQSTVRTTKKRKLSTSETEQAPATSGRLPPGSMGIAASITNAEERLYPDDHHAGHQQSPNLAYIVQSTKNLITPYTHLHSSCASTKPLQIIYASLSSQTFTITTMIVLLTDARELLKALAERQIGVVEKLEPALARFQQAGMESMLQDARAKAQKTDTDVQKLGQWLAQCDEMA
jgi:hypothetical protein